MFCFENCTTEGRDRAKGVSENVDIVNNFTNLTSTWLYQSNWLGAVFSNVPPAGGLTYTPAQPPYCPGMEKLEEMLPTDLSDRTYLYL